MFKNCYYKLIVFALIFFSALHANAIVYYRFDTRSPDEIIAQGGFKAKGDDKNLYAHSVAEHSGTGRMAESAYISFTTEFGRTALAHQLSRESRVPETWLYAVNVNGQLPNLANQLETQIRASFRALLVAEPRLIGQVDIEDVFDEIGVTVFNDRVVELSAGNGNLQSMFDIFDGLVTSWFQAIRQEEHDATDFVPWSAVVRYQRILLDRDLTDGYRVVTTTERSSVPMLPPAEPTQENRTIYVDQSRLNNAGFAIVLNPEYNLGLCGFQSTKINSNIKKCSSYSDRIAPRSTTFNPKIELGREKKVSLRYGDNPMAWVDFNGDLIPDLCNVIPGKTDSVQCNINIKSAPYDSFQWIQTTSGDVGWTNGGQAWVDVNGDGKADFCRLTNVYTVIRCSISNGSGFEAQDWISSYLDAGYPQTRKWIDVNRDGKVDFCRITSNGMVCNLSNGKGFDSKTWSFKSNDFGYSATQAWFDIDGNGYLDFCRQVTQSGTTIRCNLNLGNNQWKEVEGGNQPYPISATNQFYVHMVGTKQSYCRIYPSGSSLTCTHYNERTKSFEGKSFLLPAGIAFSSDLVMADINNDGLADICAGSDSSLVCSIFAGYNKGFLQNTIALPSKFHGTGKFSNGKKVILQKVKKGVETQYCRSFNGSESYCSDIIVKDERSKLKLP